MTEPLISPLSAAAVPPAPLPAPPESGVRRGLWWLVLAQVLFVLGVAAAGYATERFGSHLALRTAPINPRDLFYDDYLTLQYSISQVANAQWRGPQPPRRRQPAYVVLAPRQGFYEAVAAYSDKPTASAAGQLVLRGSVQDLRRNTVQIRYGLERYYVPPELRRRLRKPQPLRVQVSIAPWGQARITEVETLPVETPKTGTPGR